MERLVLKGRWVLPCPFPKINFQQKLGSQTDLPDGLSVYYAEGSAIALALNYAYQNSLQNFCVISDSLHVLQDIKTANLTSSPHPSIISNICNTLGSFDSSVNSLIWLPGHHDHPLFKTSIY